MISLRLCVFAILFLCVWSKSAVACQESVGGQDVNSPREVQAEGIIITWSETNDELRGFSQKLGDWEVLKIDPQKLNPQHKVTPVVDSNIAAVRIGDSIAAFSGEKGWWDVIELSKNSTAVPVVSPSLAVFEDNGHLYTFSANIGSWSSPTDPNLVPVQQEVKLVEHGGGKGRQKLTEWMQQLPDYMERGISVKTMTGRINITVSRRNWLPTVLQKVNELLVPQPESITDTSQGTSQDERTQDDDARIAELRAELLTLDLAVLAASGQVNNPNVDQAQQTRELRKLVEQSFDLRQQLQELEAQRLRLKLQQVENNLAVRAKSRDAMVERRMEELRRPDSGNKVPPQEQDNRSTSRDNSVGFESRAPSVGDVRIENANSTIQWPQPVEIARQLRSFRESAVRDMDATPDSERSIETWSQPLEKLISDGLLNPGTSEDARQAELRGAKARGALLQKHLNDVRRDWNYAWSAYQTQLELLQLDVNDRKVEESHAALEFKQKTDATLKLPSAYSHSEIRESEIKLERSRIAIQRAEQVLKIYADIEANEPELNPATLEGLNETQRDDAASASLPKESSQNLPQQAISMAEKLRKLRIAAEVNRKELQRHENLITQYSRPLEQLKTEGVVSVEITEDELKTQIARSKPEFDRLTGELDAATKAWRQVWNAYQAQSRLLELEVKDAENSLVSAEQTLAHTHAKSVQGLVGSQEVRDIEARRSAAVARLEKAREVLHLWQELENNEPELKPESSTKNLQVSSSGETKTQKGAGGTENVTTLNERLKELRDEALRLRKERQADEALLTQCSRPLEELKAEGIVSAETTAEELERKIEESRARYDNLFSDLQTAMSKWRETWSVYPKGLLSMEDQIKEIEHRIETEQRVLEQAEARNKAGLGDPNDVKRSELRLKYLTEDVLPGFKRSAAEMQKQFDELGPELNPDWKPESSGKNVPE